MKRFFLFTVLTLAFGACVFAQTPGDSATNDYSTNDSLIAAYERAGKQFDYSPAEDEADVPEPGAVVPKTIDGIFETFFSLVAFIPVAVQLLRKVFMPYAKGLEVQIFSWAVGILITIAGRLLNLGFLAELSIWTAMLYGVGASLAANGVFDTGIITAIFGLFGKKAT